MVSVRQSGRDRAVSATARDEILTLRAAGVPPKAIARRLGLAPSLVAQTLYEVAATRPKPAASDPKCWVSPGWSCSVRAPSRRGWKDAGLESEDPIGRSLVQVAVLTPHHNRHKRWFAGYLLDVHCLGVKDALPPRVLDEHEVESFLSRFFLAFDSPPVPCPFDLARELVFGAEHYARSLGFLPHPDFRSARRLLGEPPSEFSITFGWMGKPFYMSGPYDDPQAVLRTLDRTVGAGNYHFAVEASGLGDWLDG